MTHLSTNTSSKRLIEPKVTISDSEPIVPHSAQGLISAYKTFDEVQQIIRKSPALRTILQQWKRKKKYFELIGKKHERVVVLGSFDTWNVIDTTATYISKELKYHAITSLFLYEKGTGRKIPFSCYDHESMNDFLRRIIFGCQYSVITYSVTSGQIIETAWCSESQKPTMGIAFTRPLKKSSKCKYAFYDSNCIFCNGQKAIQKGEKLIGGWICTKDENCPIVKQGISKIVLDFYNTNPRMFLTGSDAFSNLKKPIKVFLNNKGILRMRR